MEERQNEELIVENENENDSVFEIITTIKGLSLENNNKDKNNIYISSGLLAVLVTAYIVVSVLKKEEINLIIITGVIVAVVIAIFLTSIIRSILRIKKHNNLETTLGTYDKGFIYYIDNNEPCTFHLDGIESLTVNINFKQQLDNSFIFKDRHNNLYSLENVKNHNEFLNLIKKDYPNLNLQENII